jgi:1,4-alpha-glucan branching enzyme
VRDLNDLLKRRSSLHQLDFDPSGFEWIDFLDAENSVLAFQRKDSAGERTIFIANFTPVVRYGYRIGLSASGEYREALNTDATEYGGSGVGNEGRVAAEDVAWHGQPYSAEVVLPPLALFVLEPD